MRFFIPIVFVLLCLDIKAQEISVKTIDRNAIATGYFPLPILAQKLSAPYKTDREKVRSIFRWITDHIAYDVVQYHHADPIPINDTLFGKAYDDWLTNYYAQKAINKKMGVCNDYAHLFKAFCKEARIDCAIVNGSAKHIEFDEESVDPGHAWNAVKIDNKWQLIDATWCAGTADAGVKKFHKEFTERYYLISPAKMMLDHFPDSSKWQLTNTNYTKESFHAKPYFYELPSDFNVVTIIPFKNTIRKNLLDTIVIDFVFSKRNTDLKVSLYDGNYIERNFSIPEEKDTVAPKEEILSEQLKKSIDELMNYLNTHSGDQEPVQQDAIKKPYISYKYSANGLRLRCKVFAPDKKYSRIYIFSGDRIFMAYKISNL